MTKILPRLARKALESSGASEMSVLGYCMGAPLSAMLRGHAPGVPAQELHRHGGPDRLLPGRALRPVARPALLRRGPSTWTRWAAIPADMVKMGFKLLKPTMDVSTNLNLWWNLWNPDYVVGLQRAQQVGERVPAVPRRVLPPVGAGLLPAEQADQGRARDGRDGAWICAQIRCPVLAVGAKEDNIAPPACVKPLIDVVSTRDKEYLELPGGHISLIAGRGASVHCWPKVASWLAARS